MNVVPFSNRRGFHPDRWLLGFAVALLSLAVCTPARSIKAQETSDAGSDSSVADEQTSDDGKQTLDEVLAGHSSHGEAFNEGPRQRAYLMEGTGRVSFPVTTTSEEAQAFVNQGVGQLHGFWYLEAERSFRQAAMLDPECAIAYWGCAQANRSNQDRAKGFIEEAMERLEGVTDREKRYIESLNAYLTAESGSKEDRKKRSSKYTEALEDIVLEYPDDLEAKAFLALQIWFNRSDGLPIGSYLAADALMQQIFAVEPLHPTHHFNIHLWDYRKPEMALESAAKCGPAAPAIAHMWHMPGHIYSRLKRYEDAVWQQEASARTDHAHMMRDKVMPDEIHNFAHNNEWLIRNLNFIGRSKDALDLAMNMTELPRHPKYNTVARGGSSKYGRERLFDVLTQYELWEDAVRLCQGPYLEPTDELSEQLKRARLFGGALYMTGRTTQADTFVVELKQQREDFASQRESRIEKARSDALAAEQKKEADQESDADETEEPASPAESDVAAADESPEESTTEDSKAVQEAVKKATKSFDRELETYDKSLAAIEGYQRLAVGDFAAALEKFEEAKTEQRSLVIETRFAAGETEEALKQARDLVKRHDNEILPLARLVYLLHAADEVEEAKQTFDSLRAISGSIQMHSHLVERLTPIAVELGLPEKWRVPSELADDVGERFALSDIGPFRWQPSPAPDWQLSNADGHLRSSKEFQGKPVVLIFYLGFGCLHCAEQLHAFAPQLDEFRAAGIDILAISSDNVEGLKRSIEDYDQGLPIPLVSDSSHETFRKFRVFDDFENVPLHGTFLIDENGLVRWQDISYEPFMDHEFLLQEAQRLLAQDKPQFVSREADAAVSSAPVSTKTVSPETVSPEAVSPEAVSPEAVSPDAKSSVVEGEGVSPAEAALEPCQEPIQDSGAPAESDQTHASSDELPLVYATSFELGASQWSPTDAEAWNVKQTDQGKVYSQFKKKSDYAPPHRSPFNMSLLKDTVVTDFQIDVDVLSTHEDYGHRDVCLFFGYQDPAHFYYVHLGKQADDHANQIFIVNGADRTKISLTSTEGTNWDDQWHRVRIKRNVESGRIEVFFDNMDEPVMTAEDKNFTWGLVGLGSFDDTSDWDDFTLHARKGEADNHPQ